MGCPSSDYVTMNDERLKCNKSPGNDEFDKQFAEILALFLFEVYSESLKCSQLSTTMMQGIIC